MPPEHATLAARKHPRNHPRKHPREYRCRKRPETAFRRIERFVAGAFVAAGLPADDAQTLARLMVEADLRGSDTHGVIRLPLYTRRIRAGGINPKPNIRVVSDGPPAALIEGGNGMGHLVMKRAAELAIEKAKATGVGWVGARMSNHAGPALLYVTMPLA